jgi:hypothetical protein
MQSTDANAGPPAGVHVFDAAPGPEVSTGTEEGILSPFYPPTPDACRGVSDAGLGQ